MPTCRSQDCPQASPRRKHCSFCAHSEEHRPLEETYRPHVWATQDPSDLPALAEGQRLLLFLPSVGLLGVGA